MDIDLVDIPRATSLGRARKYPYQQWVDEIAIGKARDVTAVLNGLKPENVRAAMTNVITNGNLPLRLVVAKGHLWIVRTKHGRKDARGV